MEGPDKSPPSLLYGIILDIICPLGILSSIGLFIYVNKYLIINRIFKKILGVIAVLQFLSYFFMLIVTVLVFHLNILNKWTCLSFVFIVSGIQGTCVVLITMISIIRYTITKRMTKQKLTDANETLMLVAIGMVIYFIIALLVTYVVVIGTGQENDTLCHTQNLFGTYWWVGLLYIALMATFFGLGIFADIKMISLIDETNGQNDSSAASKSQGQIPAVVGQQQITHEIPKNSSILTGGYSAVGAVLSAIVYNPCVLMDALWLFLTLCMVSALVFYPMFVFKAIKKKKEEKPAAAASGTMKQIAKPTLQFHEDEIDLEQGMAEKVTSSDHTQDDEVIEMTLPGQI